MQHTDKEVARPKAITPPHVICGFIAGYLHLLHELHTIASTYTREWTNLIWQYIEVDEVTYCGAI